MCKLIGSKSPLRNAVVFGDSEHLVGVYREVRSDIVAQSGPSRVAVLLLTPGMLHSAGPFRLHTDIANALADSGLPSLRFDLSGIGESLPVGSEYDSLDRAAHEIGQAIDYLQAHHGVERVICFGLCSGADDALHAALNDHRIIGLFAMDGCGYRTFKYFWYAFRRKYLPKLLSIQKWRRYFATGYGHAEAVPSTLQLGEDIREFPSRELAENQIDQLVGRGVGVHFHYTGGVIEYYSYANQFHDMFPNLARKLQGNDRASVSVSYQPDSDHVAFLTSHRRDLVELVRQKAIGFARIYTGGEGSSVVRPMESKAKSSSEGELVEHSETAKLGGDDSKSTGGVAASTALPLISMPTADSGVQQSY